jgi:hypothetical protein
LGEFRREDKHFTSKAEFMPDADVECCCTVVTKLVTNDFSLKLSGIYDSKQQARGKRLHSEAKNPFTRSSRAPASVNFLQAVRISAAHTKGSSLGGKRAFYLNLLRGCIR